MLVWLPELASTYGGEIDRAFYIILYLTCGGLILTEGCLIWFLWKYRRKKGRRAHYTHGNQTMEVVWTIIPAVILVGLTLMSKATWDKIRHTWPETDVNLMVTASQFNWEVRYPGLDQKLDTDDDVVLNNEMHIPVGKPIRIQLRSEDVIHSLFLPEMRVKQDAVPGLTIPVWFESTKTGDFTIACAELCGFGHSTMYGQLTVHAQDEYATWLEGAEQEASQEEETAFDGPA